MTCNRRKLIKQITISCCCSYYHRKCKAPLRMVSINNTRYQFILEVRIRMRIPIPMWFPWEWSTFVLLMGMGIRIGMAIVLMRIGIAYFIKFPPAVWTACCFCTVTCSDSLINVEEWTVIGSDSYNDDDWWVVSLINNASVVTSYSVLNSRHNIHICRL